MTVLEQIRAENPNLALIPDEELLQKLLLEYQGDLDPDVYMQSLMGEEPVVSPVEAPVLGGKRALAPTSNVNDIGFGQALTGPAKSSWARSWGPSITRLKGGIAALSGNEDRAQELYSQAQQEDRGILQNSGYVSFAQATEGPDAGVDTFVKAGLSAIGSSSPFLVEGIAGAVTGAKIGRFAGPVGAAIGAGVGAAVASFPRLFEFNLSRQQEQVSIGNLDTISEGKAALTALPQAALESVMFPVVGKLFGKVGRTEFSNIINRATTGRVAKGTALGVTGEAATEVGQQVLERYQAGLPIDTPEAIAEYKEAAFAGGFVGGAFGGAATLAGEATRAVQPTPIPVEKPVETPVQKPLEAPVVKGGIIQPQQQKDIAKQQAVEEQAKPVNFAVEQQADKFVVKEQSLDANNNIVKTTPLNVFNTQEEAIANQKESQEQKNKVSEQTFFTADEIKTENPTLGNIIDEVELLGNKIAPNVKQVYFQKDLALAKGNESAVKASGGTLGSSVDGWYDRTSDINFISTSNLDNIQETVAHENFHALQRVQNRASGLFTEQEQSALNTFLPGGTIDNINPLVQKALGNDVMTRLRERHLGSEVTPQEMQAYAFGAYTSMKAKGARLAAPNPVIRAFKKFFDFLKGVGNIFRKNKINNVQDLFEQARTGKIGKRAVPKEGIDELRTTSIQKAEQAAAKGVTPSVTEPSLSTVSLDDGSQIQSVIPSLVGQIGEKLVKSIYGPKGTIQLKKDFIASYLTPAQQKAKFGRNDDMKKASTIFNLSKLEQELRNNDGYIMLNNVPKGYERIGFGNKNLTTSYREDKAIFERGIKEILPSQQEFALSRVEFRKQIKNNNDDFGKKYGLKTSLSEGKKENLSKIGIALDKEHAETYKVIKETPRFVKGKIAEADQEIFDDAVEAGYQELKYQLELGGETAVSGTGWYNKAITDTIERVKDVIPQMREGSVAEQTDKELQFKLFLALFSPQGGPEQNLDVATQVFKTYLETGEAVTKKELFKDSSKFGVSHQSMVNSLKLVDYLSNKYGNKPGDLKDYLFSAQTYKELGKEKLDSGFFKPAKNQKKQDLDYSELSDVNKTSFNSDTGKIEDSILMPAFMFGEKVGTFFLNFNGIEGVTKDRWFSRHYYRQFGQVGIARNPKTGKPLKSETRMVSTIGGGKVKRTYPPGHDPVTKLRDVPKANDRKVMELYVEGIKQKAIDDGLIKGEDATRQNVQAILWYFEQGLYTDLGLKSVPVDYVQAVEALENKIKNDIQTGGQSYGQFYNTKSIKGTATDVKTKAKTGEVKFSVSQREEVKEDLELSVSPDTAIKDTDVKAFLKSGTDVTSYNPKEYFAAAETRGPLVGHCAACAYVIQKNYGGDVMQVSVPPKKGFNKQREKHYFNKLPDGTFIDLTGEQYGNQSVTPPQDFIGRAKIGPHQWGDSARYKGKLNKRFTDFEEKFNSIKEQDVENTSKNLDDILPPEFSISEDKELLNPSGTDVGANIDVDEFAIFEEILPNPTEVITDSITREKGYAAVRRFVNQRYAEQIKKFGKPVNIPDTNMSTFLFNIYAGRFPVGTGFGVRLGDTGFIDLVELNESETKYLSPSAFRKIGVDLSKQLGVKKFAGIRTTGARLKADAERIEKGLDLVNTRQDNIATSEEFNQEAFDEANNIELSVSNDMLTDKEIQNSALPSNVKNKLFLNRDLEDGTKISVRPNLNGRVIKGEDKLFVQTIHPGKNLGKAIGYDGAVRLVNPTLNVSQRARANIASKKINKYPMASAQGEYSSKKPTLDGQVLTFNPFVQHLFVDSDGFAVKSIQGEAVMYNTKIYTTGNLEYYTEENAPKPLEDINSEVKFKSSEEAETASQNLDDILSPEFSISERKKRLDKPDSVFELQTANEFIDKEDYQDVKNFYEERNPITTIEDLRRSEKLFEESKIKTTFDIKDEYIELYNNTLPNPLNLGVYKDVNEYLNAPRNSYLKNEIKKYGDPVNTKGLDLPLFSKEILVDDKSIGEITGIRLGNTAYIFNVIISNKKRNYISPTGFRKIGFILANELGVNKFAGQRVTGSKRKSRIDRGVEGAVAVPTTESSEFNVLPETQQFSISENKNKLDKPGSTIEVNNDPIDALNNYGVDIALSDADISKEIAEGVQKAKDGKSSFAYGSNKDLLEKYGDPVNVRGSKIPLFSVGFTIDNEIVGSAQGIKLGKTAIIDFVQLRNSENNYISPTGFRTIGFKIAQELGVNKFVGQRITGTKAIQSIIEKKVFPVVESSEFNTLSQEERIESNLEFSVTDDIVSDAHQSARNKINPKFARTTPVGYWKQYTDNVGIKLQQGIIDQYASIKKYLGDEPYKAATMTYASGGATEGALLYGVPFLDNDGAIDLKEDTLGTGLFTRLEKLGNKLPIFLEYVAGKRAEFLESEGKETGFSPEEIQTLISLRNGNEKLFDEGLADLNEFNKAFLDMGLKSGYLSQEAYDTWTGGGGYDFYLPFYRVLQEIGETQGPSAAPSIVNQPEIKKLVGSSRPIQDLLSNIVRNYNFLTEATLKNIAALKALEAGVEQGVTREVPFNERSKNAVFARRNGERVFFEVDEPVVLEALQAMNWGGWQNPAMGALRNFKRYLTLGVTFSPAFRIRNLIRDTIHSIAVGPLTYNPLENVLQGYKTLKKDKKTGLSEMRAKMAFGGGEIHFGHIYGNDPNATKMLLDRAIDVNTVMKSDGWSAGGLKLITGQLKKALRSWNETGSFAENINRAALYKQLRDKGVSHFEASYQARDLLNFSRHGASPIVRFLTQSIPFLNARIQGLDKMGRAMGPEQRTQLITTLGAYSLASIGLYMMFKDDEDFKQREQWDRDTYHWFKFPGSETAFRIPKPFEVGAIGTMAERLVEQIVDDDVHGILFVERLQHMIGETFAFDYRPQLITPAIEVYANKNEFTKRPIVTDWMKRLPATERKYAWTSSAYTFSSKLLNTISFDKIQISPVQIEHLVEGYFGFIGSSIAATVSIVDYPRNLAKITSKDSPLFMGFVKALPSRQSKYKTEFYELLSKMNEAHSLYRNFMRVGNTEDALKVLNKNKNIFAWRGAYTKVNKQLQQISNQIRIVENNKNLSEKEKLDKVRQLNILKNNIIQMIRQQTLDFEKNTGTKVKRPIFWK